MSTGILTLNVGSSSVKAAWFDAELSLQQAQREAKASGIGVTAGGHSGPPTHEAALRVVLADLRQHGELPVAAVGHRVVHGGVRFAAPVRVNDAVLHDIGALQPLAPLHQPHNVAGIRAALAAFPGVPQVACFDTAFHRTTPELNQRFALPQRLFDAGLRRYGFHGLSYESISAQLAQRGELQGRTVVAHLGNGASLCALRDGHAVATTMSFSPLDGLPMGSRCGRLDAAAVLHLVQQEGWTPEAVSRLLHEESGLLGLSGLSSDMRELEASAAPQAAMAIDYFVEHLLRELAGMAAALRGLDRLVFTGGIGENSARLRRRVLEGGAWLGLDADTATAVPGDSRATPKAPGAVQVRVLRTNEEAVIAAHTLAVALPQGAQAAAGDAGQDTKQRARDR